MGKKSMALFFWLSLLFSDLWLFLFHKKKKSYFFSQHALSLSSIFILQRWRWPQLLQESKSFLRGRLFSSSLDRISCSLALKHKATVSSNPLCLVQENPVFHLYPWQICVSTGGEKSMGSEQNRLRENTSKFILTPQTQKKSHWPNPAEQQSCCRWAGREMKGVSSAHLG